MVKAAEHDPLALFSFALRESDWVLADLLACFLIGDRRSMFRLQRALRAEQGKPGAPDSLVTLHRWADLSRQLGLDRD